MIELRPCICDNDDSIYISTFFIMEGVTFIYTSTSDEER
jgi:hypothetical protein